MGMLTTITFRNDAYHDMAKDPKGTMEKILLAMNGQPVSDNNMIAQEPVHSHDTAIYVSKGNTCVNISSFSKQEELMRHHPLFFGDIFSAIGGCVRDLSERWAKIKKDKG